MPQSKKPPREPTPYEKFRALAKRVVNTPKPPPSKPTSGNRPSPA